MRVIILGPWTNEHTFVVWSMTSLTSGDLVFPTGQTAKLGMGGGSKIPELIFMTVFARFASDIFIVVGRAASAGYDPQATEHADTKAQKRKEELPSFFASLFVPLRLCVRPVH